MNPTTIVTIVALTLACVIATKNILVFILQKAGKPEAAQKVARAEVFVELGLMVVGDIASHPNAIGATQAIKDVEAAGDKDPVLAVAAARLKAFAKLLGLTIAAMTMVVFLFVMTGCAAFWNALPAVTTVIETGNTVLAQIETWCDAYFRARPNDALQAKIDEGLTKTRDALIVLEDATRATKDIHDANLQAALAAFEDAYQVLLELVSPLGVETSGKMSAAAGPHLHVPSTLTIEGGLR